MWIFLSIIFSSSSLSADLVFENRPEEKLLGKPVLEVLEDYSAQGIKLLFSTNFVPPDMMVEAEPESDEPLKIIQEILKPHGLALKFVDGKHLVVKVRKGVDAESASSLIVIIQNAKSLESLDKLVITIKPEVPESEGYDTGFYAFFPVKPGGYTVEVKLTGYKTNRSVVQIKQDGTEIVTVNLELGPARLEELSVSASRYVLFSNSQFFIDQQAIQALPKLGDDPIRSAQRLQGSAASGFSSKSHFRGGEESENSIYLNGLKLLEPFHIRDYHSFFSSIDARSISGVQVYTGGFPSEYGDDMSGVLLLDSKQPQQALHTELGLSLFNTSILNSGYAGDGRYDWLISARRSNLDMVLKDRFGEPKYFDVFATMGFNLGSNTRILINGLIANDDVSIVTESDPAELEKSLSKTRNSSLWLRMENSWDSGFYASTSISSSHYSNHRIATVNDPEEMIADVLDYRQVELLKLQYSMKYDGMAGHSTRWGLEFSRQKAEYDYHGSAEYFGFLAGYPGIQNPVTYQIEEKPAGYSYAVYISDRFTVNDRLSLDLGLRWDKQTYTQAVYPGQISPRASLLYAFGGRKNFRFSIGRYYQSQRIQELQVEDNVSRFFAPQRADHFIAGYQWATPANYKFRIEAYYKRYSRPAPRFENLFDQIQIVPEFQPDRVRLDPQSASSRGLEFSIEHTSSEGLNWWASYTLARVADSIKGNSERRSWDQLHALQMGLSWHRDAWEVGIATRIHSGWPSTGMNLEFSSNLGRYVPKPGPRNAEQLGIFASLDFRISRKFDVRTGSLTGFIEVTNASNRNNACCVDYSIIHDMDGNAMLDRKIEEGLPRIPSIGLLWEF